MVVILGTSQGVTRFGCKTLRLVKDILLPDYLRGLSEEWFYTTLALDTAFDRSRSCPRRTSLNPANLWNIRRYAWMRKNITFLHDSIINRKCFPHYWSLWVNSRHNFLRRRPRMIWFLLVWARSWVVVTWETLKLIWLDTWFWCNVPCRVESLYLTWILQMLVPSLTGSNLDHHLSFQLWR